VRERTTVHPGTPVRDPAKRIITRNSFEIYEDQTEALRKLSFQEKMAGQVGVRVKARDARTPERPFERTLPRPNERTTHRTGLYNPLPDLLTSTIGRENLYLGSRPGSRHFPDNGFAIKNALA
jgi:hypothetical protein